MRPKDETSERSELSTGSGSAAEIEALLRERKALALADWTVERNRARLRAVDARVRHWHAVNGPAVPHEVIMRFIAEGPYRDLRATDEAEGGNGRANPRR